MPAIPNTAIPQPYKMMDTSDGFSTSENGLLLPKHYVEIESEKNRRKELCSSDPNLAAAKVSIIGSFITGLILLAISLTFTALTAPSHSPQDLVNSRYDKKIEEILDSKLPPHERAVEIKKLEQEKQQILEGLEATTQTPSTVIPRTQNNPGDDVMPSSLPNRKAEQALIRTASYYKDMSVIDRLSSQAEYARFCLSRWGQSDTYNVFPSLSNKDAGKEVVDAININIIIFGIYLIFIYIMLIELFSASYRLAKNINGFSIFKIRNRWLWEQSNIGCIRI